ncbi:MAG: hypothetical protein WDZ40_02300 [Candidatus Spechtbacterales bacterium]
MSIEKLGGAMPQDDDPQDLDELEKYDNADSGAQEQEFNPEREKEKLIQWARENLGNSEEEAGEFIEANFKIDTEKEKIIVSKNIDFSPYAETLKEIPDNTTFEGDANFGHCTSLKEIPDNTTFERRAYFGGCTSLKEIPDNIIFNGDAYFTGCSSLTPDLRGKLIKMREEGKIKGELYLSSFV